ncbi:putative oxalocrotonate tautomerase [Mycena alexandri]|uniref:Oxalocrotonate tautomerase n=1 Tax=Mycena alexandri TaxID=1745969 RepID=A0AAD6TDC9_9AGAR|nr:putative oxalocrotonate tautomerase [Mycena alexandri]
MPLHRFFVPTGLYTPEDKAAISEAITKLYSSPPASLPPFYVVVLFIEFEKGNFFNGGKATDGMARITIEHVARNFTPEYVCSINFVQTLNLCTVTLHANAVL